MDLILFRQWAIPCATTFEVDIAKATSCPFPKQMTQFGTGTKILGMSVRKPESESDCAKSGKSLLPAKFLSNMFFEMVDTKGKKILDCVPVITYARDCTHAPGQYGSLLAGDGLNLNDSKIAICCKPGAETEIPENSVIEVTLYYCDKITANSIMNCIIGR